ncbi:MULTISPECIES: sulfite oxidase [Robiginitalea]|nr:MULTISPECIES: sulfite oxidase [Robiginitalea]MDC6353110.1 sulfite oxidase [Robiginitalea sp. PM2]MDC6373723.1 sulfite oxidase [Robiginitalea sp. SP8]
MDRRKFVGRSALASMGALLGADIVYGDRLPEGLELLGLQDPDPFSLFDKDPEMVVRNSRPWNLEARAHLLDDAVTPNKYMFIRNNGLIPERPDPAAWTLTLDGEAVRGKKSYTLADLKNNFRKYTYRLTLECGGNGRSEFNPPASGNQWEVGAVSCAEWGGVRLRDVLEDAGYTDRAVYVGYHAADTHLSGDPGKEPISRGVPMEKALQDETLLAYEMNGGDIPLAHGYPLRLVAGGWPASASGKWIERLSVRDRVHDGAKMTGDSYRVPCRPVAPGTPVPDSDMCIIESMPVKSLITYPKTGATLARGRSLPFRGHAWAGELEVARVRYSIDFGSTWQDCRLEAPANRLAWQRFSGEAEFPREGYYELWAQAEDSQGRAQPMVLPGWNPKGYLNNACHRIAVKIT